MSSAVPVPVSRSDLPHLLQREPDFEVTSDNEQITMSCATDFRKVSKRERKTDFEVTSDNEQVTASCATEFRKESKREREREKQTRCQLGL